MLNRAEIIGHLGNDPAIKYMQNGDAICDISVATTEKWKDKNGEKQERTEWHRITMFGKLGEIAGEYLTKGSLVFIAGRIQTDKYTDKEGVEKYSTKIIANEMKMLGGGSGDRAERPSREAPSRNAPARSAPVREAPRQAPVDDFADDDIPF